MYMQRNYKEDLRAVIKSASVYFKRHLIDFKSIAYDELLSRILVLQRDHPESKELFKLNKEYEKLEVSSADFMYICVDQILGYIKTAKIDRDFIVYHGEVYYYLGRTWALVCSKEKANSDIKEFLSEVALIFKARRVRAFNHRFRAELYSHFVDALSERDDVRLGYDVIYFRNVVLRLDQGRHEVVKALKSDFQLTDVGYDYDVDAECPEWDKFLNRVLPHADSQAMLHEFMYYVFVVNQKDLLKLEKCLFLIGVGSNGKSVVMEVLSKLIGGVSNMSSFNIPHLTSELSDGMYARAVFSKKLLNYSSEVSTSRRGELSTLKQLISQEGFSARHPYGRPFTANRCGKLMFNANRKPRGEATVAFFRRLLLLPFDVKISKEEQDKQQHLKIISSDLPGLMNKVLEAGVRLWRNKEFTESEGHGRLLAEWQVEMDSVSAFLEDGGYSVSKTNRVAVNKIFKRYKDWAEEHGYVRRYIISTSTAFNSRLKDLGYDFHPNRINGYKMVYMECSVELVSDGFHEDDYGSGQSNERDMNTPF